MSGCAWPASQINSAAHSSGSCMVPSLSASARCAWMSLDRKSTCGQGREREDQKQHAPMTARGAAQVRVPEPDLAHSSRRRWRWQLVSLPCLRPAAASTDGARRHPPLAPHQRAVVLLVGQHLLKVGLGEVGHGGHGVRQVPPHRGVALLLAGLREQARGGPRGMVTRVAVHAQHAFIADRLSAWIRLASAWA